MNLLDFPDEILLLIIGWLQESNCGGLRLSCRRFKGICRSLFPFRPRFHEWTIRGHRHFVMKRMRHRGKWVRLKTRDVPCVQGVFLVQPYMEQTIVFSPVTQAGAHLRRKSLYFALCMFKDTFRRVKQEFIDITPSQRKVMHTYLKMVPLLMKHGCNKNDEVACRKAARFVACDERAYAKSIPSWITGPALRSLGKSTGTIGASSSCS